MNITDKDVAEFQTLYKARFGKDIDRTEARDKLSKLVRQMEIVYQPITKKQVKDLKEKDAKKQSQND
ncbi:MAG: hypothetical protein AAB395_03690 [Patescibacteria group bacterium]